MGNQNSSKKIKSDDALDNEKSTDESNFSYITIEEVVPPEKKLIYDQKKNKDWKMNLKRHPKADKSDRKMSKHVRRFYEEQNEIKTYQEQLGESINRGNTSLINKRGYFLAQLSFVINACLLISKSVAAYLTASLAVLTSVMDSLVDLISGALLWWSGKAMRKMDPYQYPGGRNRLQPFSIVILAVIMSVCSLAMIRESVETIVEYVRFDQTHETDVNESFIFCFNISGMKDFIDRHHNIIPEFHLDSILICCSTILVKLILFVVCRASPSPVAQTLAQDHRNDVLSNSGALGFGMLAHYWKYLDAIGALVICVYIICTWFITGYEQMLLLVGYTARPEFLRKLTWLAVNHHERIIAIKTLRAFHFGNEFLVEVDIILPKDMMVGEAYDIATSLQTRLEKLDEVERAFVRIDYNQED